MSDVLRRTRYAVGQHDLICKLLGVGNSPDDPGKTALEAVMDLQREVAIYRDPVIAIDELHWQLDAEQQQLRGGCDG
jgi:hypothetical protein